MKPTIFIDRVVYQKIMHWVNKSNYEVSGLGKVVVNHGVYRVVDAILLPQKNGHTHTDIEGDVVGKAMYDLRETPGSMNFWWHSHVNMNVFWSGTDMDTIKKIGEGGWFLNTVFNKKNEHRSALYVKSAFSDPVLFKETSIFLDELETRIYDPVAEALTAQWDADYELNVENQSRVFTEGLGTGITTSGTESKPWKSKKQRKKEKQLELKSDQEQDIDACVACGFIICTCDTAARLGRSDYLEVLTDSVIQGVLDENDIWTAYEEGKISDSDAQKLLRLSWDNDIADDDGPMINRHAPAEKAGPVAFTRGKRWED